MRKRVIRIDTQTYYSPALGDWWSSSSDITQKIGWLKLEEIPRDWCQESIIIIHVIKWTCFVLNFDILQIWSQSLSGFVLVRQWRETPQTALRQRAEPLTASGVRQRPDGATEDWRPRAAREGKDQTGLQRAEDGELPEKVRTRRGFRGLRTASCPRR